MERYLLGNPVVISYFERSLPPGEPALFELLPAINVYVFSKLRSSAGSRCIFVCVPVCVSACIHVCLYPRPSCMSIPASWGSVSHVVHVSVCVYTRCMCVGMCFLCLCVFHVSVHVYTRCACVWCVCLFASTIVCFMCQCAFPVIFFSFRVCTRMHTHTPYTHTNLGAGGVSAGATAGGTLNTVLSLSLSRSLAHSLSVSLSTSICVCVCTSRYTHACVYKHTCVCVYEHTQVRTHTRSKPAIHVAVHCLPSAYVCACTHTHTHTRVCVWIYTRIRRWK